MSKPENIPEADEHFANQARLVMKELDWWLDSFGEFDSDETESEQIAEVKISLDNGLYDEQKKMFVFDPTDAITASVMRYSCDEGIRDYQITFAAFIKNSEDSRGKANLQETVTVYIVEVEGKVDATCEATKNLYDADSNLTLSNSTTYEADEDAIDATLRELKDARHRLN